MIPCLHSTTAGRALPFESYVALANKAGLKMVDLDPGEVQKQGVDRVKECLARYDLRWASFGLPVNLNADESDFNEQLKTVALHGRTAMTFDVTRCTTYLLPSTDELPVPYANRLIKRIRQSADILSHYGIRLGLEFVGPHHLRNNRYPFLHSLTDLIDYLAAIDRENVGVLLDSYHWYTTGGQVEELYQLPAGKIVHVHINDADQPPEKAHDQRRLLPGEGQIDLVAFLTYLKDQGYGGPLSLEILRQQEPAEGPEEVVMKAKTLLDALFEELYSNRFRGGKRQCRKHVNKF